jgi:hypothetical protein
MYVIPREGLKVPDPFNGGHLPEEGREVPGNGYWHRRLRDKEVVLGAAPEPKSRQKKNSAKDQAENEKK